MATIDWSVRAIRDEQDIASAQKLFRDYRDWLNVDVCLKEFDDEVENLPGLYAPPKGTLLLGFFHGQAVGCAAVRPLGKPLPAGRFRLRACELKRLYVAPEARGEGIGQGLLRRALRDAHGMRYQAMVLDTYPSRMADAIRLYEQFGFVNSEPYYENPSPDVRFLFRRLT